MNISDRWSEQISWLPSLNCKLRVSSFYHPLLYVLLSSLSGVIYLVTCPQGHTNEATTSLPTISARVHRFVTPHFLHTLDLWVSAHFTAPTTYAWYDCFSAIYHHHSISQSHASSAIRSERAAQSSAALLASISRCSSIFAKDLLDPSAHLGLLPFIILW